jgi:hypothetical protein
MRTIKPPNQSDLEKKVKGQQGFGDYHNTRSYLTERKVILKLSLGPATYTQIQKETKVQRETLGKILKKFAKEGQVYKHKLARGILEHQRGLPEYYILNFTHTDVDEFLNGPYPDYVKKTFKEATKPKKSISEYGKHLPIIYGLVGYYKSPHNIEENPSVDIIKDLDRSVKRDRRYYEMRNKAYNTEQVQTSLREIKELQEETFSIEREFKKSRIEYERNLDNHCLEIGSLLTGTFGLTIWDALIMCMDCLGFSDSKYVRIWNLFQSNYPDEFIFQ